MATNNDSKVSINFRVNKDMREQIRLASKRAGCTTDTMWLTAIVRKELFNMGFR